MKSSVQIHPAQISEIDVDYVMKHRGVYIPVLDLGGYVINTGRVVLYVYNEIVELFNFEAWCGRARFTIAPANAPVVLTFVNEAPAVDVPESQPITEASLRKKSPILDIPHGSSIRKTAQYKLYNYIAENLKFFNSPDGVSMNEIRNGGIIAYIVEFGRHNSRGKICVYASNFIGVTSEIPGFSGGFSSVDEAVRQIAYFVACELNS